MVQPEFWIVGLDGPSDTAETINLALGSAGYPAPRYFADPAQVLTHIVGSRPAMIIVNLNPPDLAELTFVRRLRGALPAGTFLPVLALADGGDQANAELAVDAGVNDFLPGPLGSHQVLLHIGSLLKTSARVRYVRHLLAETIEAVGSEPAPSHFDRIARLGQAAEQSDDETGGHAARVGRLSADIAYGLGLAPEETLLIGLAAPLHDLGKAFVAHRVLAKKGEFVPFERRLMREHVAAGVALLREISCDVMRMAEVIARTHHERWDGEGYPAGLLGQGIPLPGRIVAVAEAFEAMSHLRPYKVGLSVTDALAEIKQERGRQFDPGVVDAFLQMQDRLLCLASHLLEGRASGF